MTSVTNAAQETTVKQDTTSSMDSKKDVHMSDEEARLRERLQAKKKASKETGAADAASPASDASGSAGRRRSTSRDRRSHSPHHRRPSKDGHHHHHRHHHHDRDHGGRRGSSGSGGGYRGERGPPPVGYGPHRGPPAGSWRGSGGPPSRRYSNRDVDDFGRTHRRPSRSPSRSRSRSRSRSESYYRRSRGHSPSPSRSRSRSPHASGRHHRRRGDRSRSRSRSSSASSGSYTSDSDSSRSSASSVSSAGRGDAQDTYTKDQRTVFINQLIMRATPRDVKRYLKSKEIKVNDVEFLQDRRTGKHKGSAYVELRHMPDVAKAVALSGQAPDFQRFPILIKASEAEKNYLLSSSAATTSATTLVPAQPMVGPNGKLIESQKVYVGGLDPSVTQEQLIALFSQFGTLHQVTIQTDPNTGVSKGYAFLGFRDPKESNLAIQTMTNQVLAGRPLKTGWAKQTVPKPGVDVVTSEEFPSDASTRATKAYQVLAQLTMGVPAAQLLTGGAAPPVTVTPAAPITAPATGAVSKVPTVADARASLSSAAAMGQALPVPTMLVAATVPDVPTLAGTVPAASTPSPAIDATLVGNADRPTKNVLVHNMFDKDQETEPGWAEEIRVEFQEECSKYGKISQVTVMSEEVGGKIYASFDSIEGAQSCASSLAGRWFDKRQLRTEFVPDDDLPTSANSQQQQKQ